MSRYIDADDAIYRLEKMSYNDSQPKAIRRAGKYLNAFANEQPADVEEVRHGQWLCINGTIFCSECGEKALYEYNENDNDDFPFLLPTRSKRCPHCGAHMD